MFTPAENHVTPGIGFFFSFFAFDSMCKERNESQDIGCDAKERMIGMVYSFNLGFVPSIYSHNGMRYLPNHELMNALFLPNTSRRHSCWVTKITLGKNGQAQFSRDPRPISSSRLISSYAHYDHTARNGIPRPSDDIHSLLLLSSHCGTEYIPNTSFLAVQYYDPLHAYKLSLNDIHFNTSAPRIHDGNIGFQW